jgi:hypothetical protein
VKVVLDAGALVALERGDRAVYVRVRQEQLRSGSRPVTHGGVIGQVWRGGGGRQARLATAVAKIDVRPLDRRLGRQAGVLLGRARTSDVVDAALVLLAADGDTILTSDVRDLRPLADAAGLRIDLVPV